ncbi:MAG: hypothetical protein ABIV07_02925 [Polaromonas sp.]
MSSPATPTASPSGALAGWTSRRTAWLLFAPPAVMVGLRWLLQLVDDRQSGLPALPLVPVATTTGALDLLWTVALGIAVLTVAGLLMRRAGWRRAMPAVGLVWLLLWLAGSGALLQRHLNREGLFLNGASPSAGVPVTARVITSQFKPPSLRGMGGTELVLLVPGLALPQRLLIDDARAQPVKAGDRLALQFARGRFSGLFVTGWQALPAAPS